MFSKHSIDRIKERGSSKEEVIKTINEGEKIPTKEGRLHLKRIIHIIKNGKGGNIK